MKLSKRVNKKENIVKAFSSGCPCIYGCQNSLYRNQDNYQDYKAAQLEDYN